MHQTVWTTQENVGVREEREGISCVEPAPHPGAAAMLLASFNIPCKSGYVHTQCLSVSLKPDITLLRVQ